MFKANLRRSKLFPSVLTSKQGLKTFKALPEKKKKKKSRTQEHKICSVWHQIKIFQKTKKISRHENKQKNTIHN